MQIGQYEVLGEIARGGFGVVYRARDTQGSEVAIKVLLDARDEDEVERFLREGDAATRMSHPNLVRVHGMGRDQGRPYLVMDYVDGPTLASRLARHGHLPLRESARLVADLARAVSAAHAAGVLHRDLKPENVLFEGDRPLLTDFGIARVADARTLTQTGELLGTPGYMAPEQIEGDRTRFGPPTDVYGLGAILSRSSPE
ncbi:MAG: serine/threonine protein kinase [Planctomycetes bacterium]|nr:serine/threonine protein kinase [Planctomycetota bacterium]